MSKHKKKMLCLDLLFAALLYAFDQFTKHLAVLHLKGKAALPLIDGVLELSYLENRGAAFGILQNQKGLLIAAGLVFFTVICFFLIRLPDERKYFVFHLLASAVIAGGLGNMSDRIRMDYVTDFIYFVLIDFPVFNVADIYVVTATIIALFLLLFVYREENFSFLSKKSQKGEREE